ncbi:MAG: sulfoxide reductase heme-binding subunit YedZ [Saccharospirillaceae bacterium]|nr:sulfoxide reductase heme-binding subunit YedZ [Pseudomonadales bacterium]NRB81398.1 sulfoxide reductase heme-binding subunit YedZ [Saccharospirillaceae bacterium]
MAKSKLKLRFLWWALFLVCLIPLLYNVWQIYLLFAGADHKLGSEPGKELVDHFGEITLYFLWFTLAITPIKKWLGWSKLMKYRRMFGLYVFFYASLHILSYCTFLLEWTWFILKEDIVQRPYIFVGLVAWIGLLVLTVTSPKWMVKKLKKKWVIIHKFIYLIAILVVVHEWMQLRASFYDPLLHAVILTVLLCSRFSFLKKFKKQARIS